ncbi:MAG TPA: phenylalanine--tRNA ligase subunit beta, partial [Nocardioidaceae bacterium]|nr:phenylalanine--tRNA ligase subunit beta [Nocardioidaceae bacterium]
MRVPLSWLREYVDLPGDVTADVLAHRLTALGLKLEALESPGADLAGPLVVGRVLSCVDEPQKNGKVIRWCQVDVGPEHNGEEGSRGIVCGAHNFAEGDLVVVSLPGAVLPGGFAIAARKTYGHISDGMICSTRELGTGDDHDGILVLEADEAKPGDDAIELLHLRDDVIEFEINPDRAYALSLRGVAREAAIAYGVRFRDPANRDVPMPNDHGYPVRVDAPDGCPVFATRTVTGFDPTAPTPRWLARRVQLAGMRPISLAVDVTNYVMLELGQPIHGYDGDKLSGPIVVRRAEAGETLTTLDDVKRTLSAEDLLITDDTGPIGMAGVMGGQTTELSEATSHVVIEAAHFDPVSVFRTARRHKLPSEASKRFERGVDPLLPAYAADRVAQLLVEHGGGTVEPGVTYVGGPPESHPITAPVDLPARITGMDIDTDTTLAHLRTVGCAVAVDGDTLTAVPPSWRPDLTDPYDLVEEVARIVGYDKVPSVLPVAPSGWGLTTGQKLVRRVGRTLAGAGYVEVLTYPFVGDADWDALGLEPDDERRRTVRIANPLSEEEPTLRTTLVPGLLKTLARNVGRAQTDVALFESAPVYLPGAEPKAAPILGVDRRPTDEEWAELEAAVPHQPRHLAVALSGSRELPGWWGDGRAASW